MIFGTGPFAECARYLFEYDGGRTVAAFTVHGEHVRENELHGAPIVPFEELVERHAPDDHDVFVAVGARDVNRLRASLCAEVASLGYTLASYVSPRATTFPTLEVGANVFVFENNTVQPYASVGDDVVLWSGNHIGHHSVIGDHCFVTSHVVVSGNVRVGPYCYLGVNASIRDGIEIGAGCVLGAGAVVMRSTRDREVYLGPRAELDERTSDDVRL